MNPRKPNGTQRGHRTKAERESYEPKFELGVPARPRRLSRAVASAWDQIAAGLLTKRILAKTDGDLLLAWAEAKAANQPCPAHVLAAFKSRQPFPDLSAPASDLPAPPPAAPAIDAASVAKLYAVEVTTGQIVAGKIARQACERFLNDLRDGPARGITFDPKAAQHVIDYISALDLGRLLPWQIFVLSNLFGFKNVSGLRRFRTAHIEIAKKNGKSSLLAAIGLYLVDTEGDGEVRAEVYCAATTKAQSAEICFREAVRLRENSDKLSARSKKYKTAIEFGDSVFAPLAANSDKLQGRNLHGGILDELADHPTPDLFHVFSTSKVNRKQPLLISITTAGNARLGNIAWHQREHSLQVLENVIADDSFFAFICTIDEGDEWTDEACWGKANPSLGVTVQIENLRELAARAHSIPSAKNTFLRFHLDVWPATTVTGWINADDLGKQGNAYLCEEDRLLSPLERIRAAEDRLKGRQCVLGVDLALKNDLSACAILFPPLEENGIYEVLFKVWVPEESIERRSHEHRVPYRQWADAGFISTTPGQVTDFQFIQRDILALRDHYRILELGCDGALTAATSFMEPIKDAGIAICEHLQGYRLSMEIEMLERLFIQCRMCFFGNPVAAWCFSNVSLGRNHMKRLCFDKEKSREKIDCAVALACAFKSAPAQPILNPYESRGIIFLDDMFPEERAKLPKLEY